MDPSTTKIENNMMEVVRLTKEVFSLLPPTAPEKTKRLGTSSLNQLQVVLKRPELLHGETLWPDILMNLRIFREVLTATDVALSKTGRDWWIAVLLYEIYDLNQFLLAATKAEQTHHQMEMEVDSQDAPSAWGMLVEETELRIVTLLVEIGDEFIFKGTEAALDLLDVVEDFVLCPFNGLNEFSSLRPAA